MTGLLVLVAVAAWLLGLMAMVIKILVLTAVGAQLLVLTAILVKILLYDRHFHPCADSHGGLTPCCHGDVDPSIYDCGDAAPCTCDLGD